MQVEKRSNIALEVELGLMGNLTMARCLLDIQDYSNNFKYFFCEGNLSSLDLKQGFKSGIKRG